MKIYLAILVVMVTLPTVVFANIFAAHLDSSKSIFDPALGDVSLSYRLNEDATAVSVVIYETSAPGTPVRTLVGGTASGENTVVWDGNDEGATQVPDGNYAFRVSAEDTVGHATWEFINDTTADLQQHFYSPRGLAVNTDQTTSGFGTIYVSDTYPSTTASGRTTSLGIYAVGNDGSDILGQGDTAATGGVAWDAAMGPYELAVDEAGSVWMADWSDTHSGVWRAPGGLMGTWPAMLTEANRDGSGICDNHGSVSGLLVSGEGASTVLYTRDEDVSVGAAGPGSILAYPVGTATAYAVSPTIAADDGGHTINHGSADFVNDANGDWWLSQYRWTANTDNPHVWRVDGTTGLVTHHSFDDASLLGTATAYAGMAINAAGDTLYILGHGSQTDAITVFDIATLTATSTIDTTALGLGNSHRKIAVDAAGNLLIINSSSELLRVLSPGDGPNTFVTTYHSTIGIGQATPVTSPFLYR